MPSASDFLGVTAGTPTPVPTTKVSGQSASAFLGVGGDAPSGAKQVQPHEQSWGGEALDDFTGTVSGSFEQLKNDFIKSQGPLGSKEALKKWGESPLWDQLKEQFEATKAAGKLPIDAFNAVISPLSGLIRAGIANPAAHGARAVAHTVLPGSEEMEKKGQLPNQAQMTDAVMEGLSLASPAKGARGGIAGAIGASKATRAPRSTFQHYFERPFSSPKEFAERYAARGLTREGISLEEAKKQVSKPGASISDIGTTSMIEASEQAALKGEGRRLGANLYFDERMKGREARVTKAVDELISDKSFHDTLDTYMTSRRTAAAPLYKEAFEGGSHAALKSQFENEFSEASAAAQKARQEVADADSRITLLQAKHRDVGDNVYGNASKNEDLKAAAEQKAQAQLQLDAAEAQKDTALDRLRVAQDHEAKGVKGGLWSPRLQQFLDDPIIQEGIREGFRTMELDALGDGIAFNPTEYAVTIGHNSREFAVSKVPNLRLLDAAKRGLDDILERYRNDTTGQLVLDQRGQAIEKVRKAFVEELDNLTKDTNPAYKAARQAWAGPSRIMDAVHKGREFHTMDHEEISRYVKGLTEDEHEGFKIGISRNLSDQITSGGRGAINAAKRIAESTSMQKKLRAALQDDAAADHLIEMAEREVEYQKRGSQILGGSPTARRSEAGKEFEEIAPVLDEMISSARHGMTGIAANTGRQLSRIVTSWIGKRITGLSDARREALAKLLFSTNKDDNIRALELLYDDGTVTVPGIPKRRAILPAAAAAAPSLGGQQQQQPASPQ